MTPSELTYRVKVLPAQHELEVEITLRGAARDPLFQLATWVPGAYGFMKYGRDLFDLRAFDADSGSELPISPDGWQAWRVRGAAAAVRVTYKAYAYDPAWGELCGLVDHQHAVLLGTHYLSVPEHRGPCRVSYTFPPGWPVHHPAGAKSIEPTTWEYPSFGVLLDTPVVAGEFDRRTRRVLGTDFHFVFLDGTVGFHSEVDRFIDALVKVAEECHAIFGSFPFASYTFVFSFHPAAHWGLEHASSTMIGLNAAAMISPEHRARGVRVAAHELFHAWNVCTLKPAPFMVYEPTGSFTEGLWVSEGFTRYYEFLLSVRAGEVTPQAFFSNIVNYYRHLEAMPAYRRVSPIHSSLATFLNHNRYPGSINNTVDYYDAGMLVAFDLDARLRTAGATSLDAQFAAFYRAFAGRERGFTTEHVRTFFGSKAPGLEAQLRREVEAPAGLSVPEQLESLGFEVGWETVPYLGLVLKDNAGPGIANVLDTGPAGATGIAPEDEILRLNGFVYSLDGLRWILAHEKTVNLEVKRGHRILTFSAQTGERRQVGSLVWRGTAAQLELIRGWLKRPELVLEVGTPVPLTSFENFHGIQTVL